MLLLLATILGFLSLPTAFGFNWTYSVAPRQCSNFTVAVTGADVVFPLTVLIVPVGPSPVAHEVRRVMEVAFPTNATTVSFQLRYPTGSKFVGLVADASGYHGNAHTWTMLSSDDASCFEDVQDAVSPFTFSLSPTAIAECRDVRIYWDSATVQGTPSFLSVIPDGPFRTIPLGKIDTQPDRGTGFIWTPAIRARTNLIIVGGDNRGMGSGGFINNFVDPGDPSRDASGVCPAPAARTGTTSDSRVSVGAIVAGLLGGIIFISSVIFLIYLLRRKKAKPQMMKPGMKKALPNSGYYGGSAPYPGVPIPLEQKYGCVVHDTAVPLPAYTKESDAATGGQSWKVSPAQTTAQ